VGGEEATKIRDQESGYESGEKRAETERLG
jgi:hypothetical protein